MESAILFGNGLNRIAGNGMSWEELLTKLSSVRPLPSNSNTLNYECIYLDRCRDYTSLEKENAKKVEYDLKSQIAEACSVFHTGAIYEALAQLPVHVYLTTNYDGVLDRTLKEMGYNFDKELSCMNEALYSVRRCHAYHKNHEVIGKRIFPIHGEYSVPKSIMIGYDHYCGSLGKLDDFFKGNYTYQQNEQTIKLPSLLARLGSEDKRVDMGMYWPDYFFTHNIHIIGLGLQFVETDLWWVLNKRSRNLQLTDSIKNRIYFYGSPDDQITNLLEAFDVNVVRVSAKNPKEPASWTEAYRIMMAEMRKRINE